MLPLQYAQTYFSDVTLWMKPCNSMSLLWTVKIYIQWVKFCVQWIVFVWLSSVTNFIPYSGAKTKRPSDWGGRGGGDSWVGYHYPNPNPNYPVQTVNLMNWESRSTLIVSIKYYWRRWRRRNVVEKQQSRSSAESGGEVHTAGSGLPGVFFIAVTCTFFFFFKVLPSGSHLWTPFRENDPSTRPRSTPHTAVLLNQLTRDIPSIANQHCICWSIQGKTYIFCSSPFSFFVSFHDTIQFFFVCFW